MPRPKLVDHFVRALRPALLAAAVILILLAPISTPAQISKGYQILLNRGLQLQGMVEWDDYFHLDTYSNANYTSINWFNPYNPPLMGPPPGFPWSRWVNAETNMPPQIMQGVDETPYMSQLISLELADELNLNDGPTFTNEVNWFNDVRSNFPHTILYINNYAGQVSDSTLGNFIAQAHPDMICFDEYPFQADYNTRIPNDWPFTSWFSELRRYRQWSISAGIPFGTYMQTFHSVEDYDQRVYRDPSPSELRFNISAALAFNAKVLTGFTYNSGATSLFTMVDVGYSGDRYTNALYLEQQDANRRAQNLGRALMCLKPINDLHNQNAVNPPPGPASSDPCACLAAGITTSIMIIEGRSLSGGVTNYTSPPPISFQADPETTSLNPANPANSFYTWWEYQKNDPYLIGWTVTNIGTVNNNLPGQVIVSWFTPLDESFDGPTYNNEVYIMVVNALTETNGTAADCRQDIRLNFASTVPSAVVMLDPETGLLQTNTMPTIPSSGGRRQLVLDLNGGDAALFKFNDGAPFVGHIPPGKAKLAALMQSGLPALNLTQLTPGARYLIQSSPSQANPAWSTLNGLVWTNSTYTFVDTGYTNNSSVFYRVVGVP